MEKDHCNCYPWSHVRLAIKSTIKHQCVKLVQEKYGVTEKAIKITCTREQIQTSVLSIQRIVTSYIRHVIVTHII